MIDCLVNDVSSQISDSDGSHGHDINDIDY